MPEPESPEATTDERHAMMKLLSDFFLDLAVRGYTGDVLDGRPVVNTTSEIVANLDFAKAFRETMAARGTDVNTIAPPIRAAFEYFMEMSFKSIIFSHGKLPGTITEAEAQRIRDARP